MANYLVTGGAGFIGSHIVEALLREGHSVRVFDNFSTGTQANIHFVRQALIAEGVDCSQTLDIFEGDIRSYHLVQDAVAGIDYVIHQAALPSVPRSVRDPLTSNDVNVSGTLNVLYAAKEAGVTRLVNASSSSVYGNAPTLPKVESMQPQPRSPYAVSKLSAEKYCQVFFEMYDLETVSLRYFNVFGPRQDPNSHYSAVIPRFIRSALKGDPLTVHGDGLQSRDFTYVANVVQANLLACTAPGAGGAVVNASCGGRYTLLDVISAIQNLSDTQVQVVHFPSRVGDVKDSQADIAAAERFLGYKPVIGFEEGFKRTFAWYQTEL